MGDKHRTPHTPEEEAVLGEEIKLPSVPDSFPEPAEQSTTPSASSLSPIPQRQKSLGGELMLTQIIPVDGFTFTSRRMIQYQNGGENSNCSSTPQMNASAMSWSKEWPASNPWPSGCQPHNWNKMVHGLPHPAWDC